MTPRANDTGVVCAGQSRSCREGPAMLSRETVLLAGLILLTLAVCYFTVMLGRGLVDGNLTASDAVRSFGAGLCTAAWFGGWWLCYRRGHPIAVALITTGEHVEAESHVAVDAMNQEFEPLRFRAGVICFTATLLLLNCMTLLLTVWLSRQWSVGILTALVLVVAVHLVTLPLSLVMRQGSAATGFAAGLGSCLAIMVFFDMFLLGQSLMGV